MKTPYLLVDYQHIAYFQILFTDILYIESLSIDQIRFRQQNSQNIIIGYHFQGFLTIHIHVIVYAIKVKSSTG